MLRYAQAAALALLAAACSATPEGYRTGIAAWESQPMGAPQDSVDPVALPASPVTSDLVSHALLHHRGLQAAFHRWKAALERVPQAGSLPDLRLTFSAAVLGNVETRNGPLLGAVGLSQELPWFGTLDARANREVLAAEAAREEFEAMRVQVVEEVRDAWYEYAYLARALSITESHMELLRYSEVVARSRYETGAGPFSDVTRAQLEMGILEDRLRTLADMRTPLVAQLNAALDRPPAAELAWPHEDLPIPASINSQALHAQLPETSPHLRAFRRHAEAARAGIAVAEKAFYPSFNVGAEYSFLGSTSLPGAPDPGQDSLGVRVGISLPFFSSRPGAALRESRANEVAAHASWENATRAASSSLERALYEIRDANRRAELYSATLLPKAEESLQATLAAYETGAATFLEYLDSERVLLEFLLATARAETDRAQALATAERITGVSLHREL